MGGFYYLEKKHFWLDKPARLTIFGFVSDCRLRCEKKTNRETMTLSDRFSKPHDTMLRAGEDEEVDGLALMEPNLPARTGRPRGNLALMEGRQGGRELLLIFKFCEQSFCRTCPDGSEPAKCPRENV